MHWLLSKYDIQLSLKNLHLSAAPAHVNIEWLVMLAQK